MAEKIKTVRGFRDLLGEEAKKYRFVVNTVRKILERYNFEEIILPTVEYTKLFTRSIGEATDIVEKEMFTFTDKGGRDVALRPEGTAGVVRAYIENKLYADGTYKKLYYEGSMFRHERPQKGRYREFHQIGAEILGTSNPLADAEVIKISEEILKTLKIPARIEINSLGCKKCRPAYREALLEYLSSHKEELCEDCQRRLERNPLRILDCKVEGCKLIASQAPKITDYLCEECKTHYESVKKYLNALGIKYTENPHLVRGLDYYSKTVFECVSEELGKTVIAGGRYDYLVEELGGPPTPALGFAAGIERLALLVKELPKEKPLVLVIPFGGENEKIHALKLAQTLRKNGIRVELSYREGKIRKQFEFANKIGAHFTVVVGENELKEGKYPLKNLLTREERKLTLEEIVETLKNL
ncbi:MAG: histidine--tRNA ligase [Gammaproteobacteria bacterium]|nr:MAG: histidine--tRNA ligase [Gammaproteobacteria bacterium]